MALGLTGHPHPRPPLTDDRNLVGAWRARRIPDHAWKALEGQTRRDAQAEQDHAAGGRHRRHLTTPAGDRATARVTFKARPRTRRAYAYLVWNHHRVRHELLLGEADQPTRRENLGLAWTLIQKYELLNHVARDRWPRTVTPPE